MSKPARMLGLAALALALGGCATTYTDGTNPITGNKQVLLESAQKLEVATVNAKMRVHDSSWTLSAAPATRSWTRRPFATRFGAAKSPRPASMTWTSAGATPT